MSKIMDRLRKLSEHPIPVQITVKPERWWYVLLPWKRKKMKIKKEALEYIMNQKEFRDEVQKKMIDELIYGKIITK